MGFTSFLGSFTAEIQLVFQGIFLNFTAFQRRCGCNHPPKTGRFP